MMRFKLSFDEPKFFVNEKMGIVTCVMHCYLKGQDWAMKEMGDVIDGYKDNPISHGFTITEIAHLDPQDTFDVEIGKKVARAKAESSAYRYMTKSLIRVVGKYCNMLSDGLNAFGEKAAGVIAHNKRFLEQF